MSDKSDSAEKPKKALTKKIRFNFEDSKTLQDWVSLINDNENAPLGAYTHKLINSKITDPNLNFDEAQKILEKAQFKNKLLRIADTVYLNPVETTFSTIARAMVILGFQSLRNLSIFLGIYNHIFELSQEEFLLKEIVSSIHSAILTALIVQRKARILNCEPIVGAAFSLSLGKILFLFFGGETAKQYQEILESSNEIDEKEERDLIGFSLKELSIELVKVWGLGSHALSVQDNPAPDNVVYAAILAKEIVHNLSKGWQHDSAIESIKKLGTYLKCSPEEANTIVMESLEKLLEEVALYGNYQLMDYISMPAQEEDLSDEKVNEELEKVVPITSRIKATIQALSILVSGRTLPSVNDVMNMGLKGIYDGVDFDRVLFALLNADRTVLNGKSILENQKSDLLQNFHFQLTLPEGWLFQHLLREKRSAWLGGKGEIVLKKYRNSHFNQKVGKGQFFVAPLILDGRAIGVYYADRQPSSRMLDTRSYDAFSELCTTINENIELVRKREKQKK
ncbi:MAG: HDOD domain-containing protein [Proteobacteria bacterium]|nr:HDOD domain-containing protein [Pseudomonadota bacterium]